MVENKLGAQLSTGGAGLPCFSASILGKDIGFCFSTYSDQLSVLGNLILFVAAVIALFIIFREDK
ncbi:MAG: hypothetical protein CMK74_20775 [Pseudomonadales bacterium]|nr:hypothetical protein [Pseudomonadales bacterium]